MESRKKREDMAIMANVGPGQTQDLCIISIITSWREHWSSTLQRSKFPTLLITQRHKR